MITYVMRLCQEEKKEAGTFSRRNLKSEREAGPSERVNSRQPASDHEDSRPDGIIQTFPPQPLQRSRGWYSIALSKVNFYFKYRDSCSLRENERAS